LNAAVEFTGPGVSSLSMDARLTIANMSTEWGALVGWFPVDEVTLAYLKARREHLAATGIERIREADLKAWAASPPMPDPDAAYAARITLDLSELTPHISGPDTVWKMTSLAEMEKRRVAIQKAYLVSCVNSRVEDLAEAAEVLAGKKVAPQVKFYLAPASREVQTEAERRGIWQTILDAGAIALPPGCGPCIGLGTGLLEPGEVGISATNRNFKGRMGSRDAQCYLSSPAVVAASAVAGYICGPAEWSQREVARRIELFAGVSAPTKEKVEILSGFPRELRGRLVFLPQDNLNTDAIYSGELTYMDDVPREKMAEAVMQNYDPEFAGRARASDVLVSGFNFGTGSSREQAVTSLSAKGIPIVIAGSFSQTYLRNAFNSGYPCVECPGLVVRLREQLARAIAEGQRTIIPGDEVIIDFASGTIDWKGEQFLFPALGRVAQSLVAVGGVENLIRQRLGLA
jgi:homoaconitate hydratase